MWPHSNCLEPLRLKAWMLTIPGAQQTVSIQEKDSFVLTLQNLYVLPTSKRRGSITKLCQIFVQI